jgi:hypothetical protein
MTTDNNSPFSEATSPKTPENGEEGFGDNAAVSELIADIEAELRLHQARVQEFLDGTREFGAITTSAERARLIRTAQALSSVLSDLSDLL